MNNSDSISLVQLPTEATCLTVTYKPHLQGSFKIDIPKSYIQNFLGNLKSRNSEHIKIWKFIRKTETKQRANGW